MKRNLFIIGLLCILQTLFCQVPAGMTYQAVARDLQGNPLPDLYMLVRLTFYQDNTAVWSEDHMVVTDSRGLFSLVIGEPSVPGSGSAGSFDAINWAEGELELGLELDFGEGITDLGRSRLLSVPYALYAAGGPGVEGQSLSLEGNVLTISGGNSVELPGSADTDPTNELQDLSFTGQTLALSGDPTPTAINLSDIVVSASGWQRTGDTISTGQYVGIGTSSPNRSALTVQGKDLTAGQPLFEVRREDGVPVFAVYNDGVIVFVDEDAPQKALKGGFAVGGYKKNGKGLTQEYLRVTPDSVRIFVPETAPGKGAKGGFAVGGYSRSAKGPGQDLLVVNPDSVRIYVPNKENDPGFVGLQGGFAVNTYDPLQAGQSPKEYIMGVNRGITRFNTSDNRQGFAVGSQGEGWSSSYLQVTPVNTFVGFESGINTRNDPDAWNASQGSMNVFLGYKSGKANRYGHHNVFLGYQAGSSMVGDSLDEFSGGHNIFIGPAAGLSFKTGNSNIFLGSGAGASVTNSVGNIFIGREAGSPGSDLFNNLIIGNSAGSQVSGSENIILGSSAAAQGNAGSGNVIIGNYAGYYNSGSGNVFLGNYAGYNEDSNNRLYIDNSDTNRPLLFGEFDSGFLRINSFASINDFTESQYRLKVVEDRADSYTNAVYVQHNATAGAGTAIYGIGGSTGVYGQSSNTGSGSRYGMQGWAYNGTYNYGIAGYAFTGTYNYGVYGYANSGTSYAVYASGNLAYTGSLIAASDGKLKEEVRTLGPSLEKIMQVQPRSYHFRDDAASKGYSLPDVPQYGFIAQELELVFPELVVEVRQPAGPGPDGRAEETDLSYKGVKYMEMIPVLLKAIQEQQEEIEQLRQRITELERGR
ncbi:MAG: tail fiber domain-containing protein [Bacteroidota bacterium]